MIPIRDSLRSTQTPYVVYALIGVNFIVFLYQIGLPEVDSTVLTYRYGLVPMRYSDPNWAYDHGLSPDDYLPFITGIFLHGGFLHIVLNMWTLFIFGSSLEARIGSGVFLIFYLLCGAGASFVHMAFNQQSAFPAIGASGAIAGVIGAYAVAFPQSRLVLIVPVFFLPLFFEVRAMWFAVFWFVIQIMQGAMELAKPSMGGGIAWWAHVGGFMLGMGLAPFLPARRVGRPDPRWPSAGQRRASGREGEEDNEPQPRERGPWG
jgi:membrane associated rhomboid family serine protease